MRKRGKMVPIKVPLEYAGVVQGALSFALETARGWPEALAREPDRIHCVDAVCDAISQLKRAREAAKGGTP